MKMQKPSSWGFPWYKDAAKDQANAEQQEVVVSGHLSVFQYDVSDSVRGISVGW
ncbi:hypothetical protein PMIN06_001542 [Paraphaeosphaeria minitans]